MKMLEVWLMLKRNLTLLITGFIAITYALPAQSTGTEIPSAPVSQVSYSNSEPPDITMADSLPQAPILTRTKAEQIALRHNPTISVAALLALAQKQVVREARAAALPSLYGNATGEVAEEASRLAGGANTLSASRLLNHVGAGVALSQLITDFGRTHNLVASSSLQAKAAAQNAEATREDIILATDTAFYNALEAQATLRVARSTVAERQTVSNQINALTASNLKSTLDQSFANVNLSQAKLLELDSQNQANAAMAGLNDLLGTTSNQNYRLVDDSSPLPAIPPAVDGVIALALQQRPDLLALKLQHEADVRFSRAQHEQLLPTISALGAVGVTPVGSGTYFPQNWYGGAAVEVSVPIFNGFKFTAQAKQAELQAKASDEKTRELADRIVRDVHTAWLQANTAQQKLSVTQELVQEANSALDLAQTRYRLGLSSIVELSQAQLQQTQALIDNANARFEYEADLAFLRFQSGS
jgi:outer membrane protein